VLTSAGGASRVYDATDGGVLLRESAPGMLLDGGGRAWRVGEASLRPEAEDAGLAPLSRVPARIAYWFGWYAQFPDTELVR
jgi:hypothetical protein